MPIAFDTSYARLPERFFAALEPNPVEAPRLLRLNHALAAELGLDPVELSTPEGLAWLAGNAVPPGAAFIAQAYAGHQFGHFTPRLGDGRAVLVGEVVTPTGSRRDLQLKGSGRTPFSRGGDGRAALGPVLREFLVSEAMAALGIPTTRALAAVATGEWLWRETDLPGAVLTRVAASHIRVGTFQFFAAQEDNEALALLAEHARARHYPEAEGPLGLLRGVIAAQARLVARWLLVGFIHGVMNTDNCAISGETIDYGPCAFMDAYNPATVFSSIDHQGRYAYGQQPRIAQWNLARLAEALLPLLAEDSDTAVALAQEALAEFPEHFHGAYRAGLCRKIGLPEASEANAALAQELLALMAQDKADFTLTFRTLCAAAESPEADAAMRALLTTPGAYNAWAARWRPLLPAGAASAMRRENPAYIPRNHLVEAALEAATRDDFGPFEALHLVLGQPFEEVPGQEEYALPPAVERPGYQTFCGT